MKTETEMMLIKQELEYKPEPSYLLKVWRKFIFIAFIFAWRDLYGSMINIDDNNEVVTDLGKGLWVMVWGFIITIIWICLIALLPLLMLIYSYNDDDMKLKK